MKFFSFFAFAASVWLSSACQRTDSSQPDTESKTALKNQPMPATVKTVLFFGNSLTAGYELDPSEAFTARIQEKIDSAALPYKVVNAGLSGETTAGGRERIGWVLKGAVDVFVLELGANDGLRGIDLRSTRQNLQAIIDAVRRKNPQVRIVLAGMEMPPNLGQSYTTQFRNLFRELAQENDIALIPFLLAGVAGNRSLNLPDGMHPTAEGYKIVANNVWEVLEPVLTE